TGEVSYLEAPGNYSAAGWGQSGFLVNGLNLGGPAWAVGVYGLNVESPAPNRTRPVAEFPETWRAANGYIAVTPAGVTVLGHYSSLDNRTRMHAVPPGPVRRALDGGGPLAVASGLEVYAGGDLLGAAAFGEGVALLRGAFESIPPYRAIPEEIRRVPLNVVRPNGGLEAVTAGDSEVVLDAVDACTEVPYLTSLGEGLALVISDARSRRLVVVAPE
ncbi:MAG TPA: hypothetical protein VEY30_12350, partial [Myxococcaceae bacterium]|nr:hypothetical protein [Myxococcaceae bacterium]